MLVSKNNELHTLCREWDEAFGGKFNVKIFPEKSYRTGTKNIVPCDSTANTPK
jgi:hypothetical protein